MHLFIGNPVHLVCDCVNLTFNTVKPMVDPHYTKEEGADIASNGNN
jgi:hypothetical protein